MKSERHAWSRRHACIITRRISHDDGITLFPNFEGREEDEPRAKSFGLPSFIRPRAFIGRRRPVNLPLPRSIRPATLLPSFAVHPWLKRHRLYLCHRRTQLPPGDHDSLRCCTEAGGVRIAYKSQEQKGSMTFNLAVFLSLAINAAVPRVRPRNEPIRHAHPPHFAT